MRPGATLVAVVPHDDVEAAVRSSNPVLTRLTPENQTGYQAGYRSPGSYGSTTGYAQQTDYYNSPVVAAGASDRLTIDDVVIRTVTLLAVTGISGFLAVYLVPNDIAVPVWIGAALIGLVLGLIISFKQISSPPLILTYAVVEGVFVGMVSKAYESWYDGIVVQAAAGTFGIFLIMTALYKFRVIRATPRFARGVMAAVFGIFGIILVNWILSLFGVTTGIRGNADGSGGTLAIVFSIVVIVIASLTFILDFALIEESIARGAPKRMAWTCAFGLLVGLIWVYLEVLRLLSYLRGRD
jgi:uncharacterized YccA/Bax inhibitor family protein